MDHFIEQIAEPLPGNPVETKVSYQYHANGNVSTMDFASRNSVTQPFAIIYSKVFTEYVNKNPVPDDVPDSF